MNIPGFQSFSEQLDTFFHAVSTESDAVFSLRLIEAVDMGNSMHEQFTLLFRGPEEPILPQMIYTLKHSDLDEVSLFLVPVGKNQEGVLYEAVIHRFKEAPLPTSP